MGIWQNASGQPIVDSEGRIIECDGHPCGDCGVQTITVEPTGSPTRINRYVLSATNDGDSVDQYSGNTVNSVNYAPSRSGAGFGIAAATISGVTGLYEFNVSDLASGLSLVASTSNLFYAVGRECNGIDTIYHTEGASAYSGGTLTDSASFSSKSNLSSPNVSRVLYDGSKFWICDTQKIVDESGSTLTTLGASGSDRIVGILSDDATDFYALLDNSSTGTTKLYHIDGAYSYTLLASVTASGSGFVSHFSLLDDAIYWIDRREENVQRYDVSTATFDGSVLAHEIDGMSPDSWTNVSKYGFVVYDGT